VSADVQLLEPAAAHVAPLELEQAMELLSGISASLSSSYTRLADHARRVEDELLGANAALATKVRELDELRAHLEGILAALPMGVVVRDGAGRIRRLNAAALRLLDETGTDVLRGAQSDESSREHFTHSGSRRVIAERFSRIDDASGATVQILDDRTELVELAERVHKLDKLAALGTMAAGIAHEIRNPMNAMLGFAELLKRELPQHSREYRFASRISDGVVEVDAIITNMLSFANPQRLVLETCDARAVVEGAIELVQRAADADQPVARITHDVPETAFAADRIKIRQALRNLVANALQAQPAGGAVHVSLTRDARGLSFHVVDRGPGIPAALRQRLGDPFFTTRAEGTGLGLSLVHTIAELHGGRFEVCPHPPTCPHGLGAGAHVVLHLPLQQTERT